MRREIFFAHFFTESRVHAADVLTDAENGRRAAVIYIRVFHPLSPGPGGKKYE